MSVSVPPQVHGRLWKTPDRKPNVWQPYTVRNTTERGALQQ
jgi:hypothetical protein